MAEAASSRASLPVCDGPAQTAPQSKAGGALANWFAETLSRSRRSSLSSECSEDTCNSDVCSTSGRPSWMSRLSRRSAKHQSTASAERSSEDSSSSVHTARPAAPASACDMSEEDCDEASSERIGYLLRGSPVRIVAPEEFLDPVTDCLILEPVTLLNTDTTLDRLTLQEWLRNGNASCPCTHAPLNDWICVRSNDDLRGRIASWAEQCGIDLDALISAHYAKQAGA